VVGHAPAFTAPALADHLTEHGLVLEMLAGPLPGIHDPHRPRQAAVRLTVGPRPDELLLPSLSVTAQISHGLLPRRGHPPWPPGPTVR
jgi:hypothetical protein